MNYKTKKRAVIIAIIASGFLGLKFSCHAHRPILVDHSVKSHDVTVIQSEHYPTLFVNQLKGDPEAGRKIYVAFCASCHSNHPPIETRAPRLNDKVAWHAIHELGMPMILKLVIRGLGAMPARGGCFECSDEQLQQTIQYMLDQSS